MENNYTLSAKQKMMFLALALLSMLLLASGSVSLAAKHYTLCIVFFLCAACTIGIGFMIRKRTRKAR